VRRGDVLLHNILTLHIAPPVAGEQRRVIYFGYWPAEVDYHLGPHSREYIGLKQQVLLASIEARKTAQAGRGERPFEYRAAEAMRLWKDTTLATFRFPARGLLDLAGRRLTSMPEPSQARTVPPMLADVLAELYRERAEPAPGDRHYPHLLDIRDAVRDAVRNAVGTWLDYGAATSPYRGLFTNARLLTADMASSSWKYPVDYPLDDDGHLPVEDGTFDGVLSTQVLEHVPNPAAYLHEAMPVLRPGGRLVLTTHGVWEDHGPVDLFRWTAQGLTAEVTAAGYTVDQCLMLTCGARAVLHLLQRESRAAAWPGSGPAALLLRGIRALDRWRPGHLDRYSDLHLRGLRRAPAGEHGFYLALPVSASRP